MGTRINSQQKQALSWSVKQRLEFIEFRLYWEEKINRSDLISFFGVSVPQASADFSKYQEIAPRNMLYDKSQKFYYASDAFNPILIKPTSEQYLLRYFAVKSGILTPEHSFLGFFPPTETVPVPRRRVEPNILKDILRSMRKHLSIAIEYQSMSRTESLTRWISPHALGFDGFRWHCRAYCHIDNIFKDFILGRISNIAKEKKTDIDPLTDVEWETYVTVRIGPNPELDENRKRAIEYEYGMQNGETAIFLRKAMALYLLSNLNFSEKQKEQQDNIYHKKHIVLLNPEEFKDELALI